MENKMKSYLKEEYTDNYILNFLKYWQKPETPRMENDLDCLYLGNLLADTIFSVFIPMKMVVECLNPGLVINKRYKEDKYKDLRILQKDIESRGILLPKDNELVILLNRYASLAETRANTVEIPDNKMQNRNKYDQITNMIYNCFNGGKFYKYFNFNENFVKEWIVKEKLQMLFRHENKLTRDSIRPLIHTLEPNQVKLLKRKDDISEMLQQNFDCLEKRLSYYV